MGEKNLWSIVGVSCALLLLLSSCGESPEASVAFTHVHLVPMTTESVLDDQTVVVQGTTIVAVGPSDGVHVPQGTHEIDGRGSYLMPGLADMHMHTRRDWDDPDVWPAHPLHLYLANGVTTVRDFAPQGSPLTYVLQWRDEIQTGDRRGPTIYASGQLLYASPLDDPTGIVRRNHEFGFDFLKLYSYLSPEDFHDAVCTAQELDMYTSGHIPYAMGLEEVLREGMDEIAHVEELLFEFVPFNRNQHLTPDEWLSHIGERAMEQWTTGSPTFRTDFEDANGPALSRVADRLHSTGTPVCTTMVIDDVIQMKLFDLEAFLRRPENRYLPSAYWESLRHGEEKHQVIFSNMETLAASKYEIDCLLLAALRESGVTLLLGTDAGTGGMGIVPGYSLHDELRILVENGFSPYEALVTGTVNAALVVERMTGDRCFGTIEEGKRADLILVEENPLEGVATIREPLGVMAAGRWYSRDMLAEMIARFGQSVRERE